MAERLTSMGTALYTSADGTSWTEVEDVKSIPALMGDLNKVDVTCIRDANKRYGAGQQDAGDMEFTLAYTGQGAGTNWALLMGIKKEQGFRVVYPDNSGFEWKGTVRLKDGAIGDGDSPIEFGMTMLPTSDITPVEKFTGITPPTPAP